MKTHFLATTYWSTLCICHQIWTYNTSTKVSLKDNQWVWMSHLTQLSSGQGHHRAVACTQFNLAFEKKKKVSTCNIDRILVEESIVNQACGYHRQDNQSAFTHQHSKVTQRKPHNLGLDRVCLSSDFYRDLHRKTSHNQPEEKTGFIFMHPLCNPTGLTGRLFGTTLNTAHAVLKAHKSVR